MAEDFIEEPRFPDNIARGATVAPQYEVEIEQLRSGFTLRNPVHEYPLYECDASTGISNIEDIEDILDLFHVAHGPTMGFRFKDYLDYKSCRVGATPSATDQILTPDLNLDPTGRTFPVTKTYLWGVKSKTRPIFKLVSGTVLVADAGLPVSEGVAYTVDYELGLIIFLADPNGTVTAGYEFDLPVYFEDEKLPARLDSHQVATAPIKLMEMRLDRS